MVTGILSLSSFILWNEEPIKGPHHFFFFGRRLDTCQPTVTQMLKKKRAHNLQNMWKREPFLFRRELQGCKLNQTFAKLLSVTIAFTSVSREKTTVMAIKGYWCRMEATISPSRLNTDAETTLSTGCLSVTGHAAEQAAAVLSKRIQVEGQEGEEVEVKAGSQPAKSASSSVSKQPVNYVHLGVSCLCARSLKLKAGRSAPSLLLWSIESNSQQVAAGLKGDIPSAHLCRSL